MPVNTSCVMCQLDRAITNRYHHMLEEHDRVLYLLEDTGIDDIDDLTTELVGWDRWLIGTHDGSPALGYRTG